MGRSFKVVVIGGVAAGPKIAAKVVRLRPDAEVTVVEKGMFLSYAGCGLPYYISGVVPDQKELMETPIGVMRDPEYFKTVKNFTAHNRTEALEIDRAAKRVRLKNLENATEWWVEYDKLALATGARPAVPPIPGIRLRNIFTLKGIEDAEAIKRLLEEERAKDIVIVGGGLIGVEVTEALVAKGARVTIIEILPQILSMLDWEMARQVEKHLECKGVRVLTETGVERFEGDGEVEAVVAGGRRIPTDGVILAVGVRPEVALAKASGIELGPTGAIAVDEHMRTSDPDIYAAGDCVEVKNLVTGKPAYVPLGSTANKQGRVAAINICGGEDKFPGVLESTICKVFDFTVGCTGLNERTARELGYDVVSCLYPAPDKAHYYPTAQALMLKLVADRKSGRLLGVQAVGPGDGAKRLDTAAAAITAAMTVEQVSKLDLCYAPPYSAALDNLITAANVLRNKMEGRMDGISPAELKERLDRGEDIVLLDVRTPAEHGEKHIPNSILIPMADLRRRLGELPRDKEIVVYCGSSLRAYESSILLRESGFANVRVLDGSIAMWPYELAMRTGECGE